MRILHVVSSFQRRGAETFAADLGRAWSGLNQRYAVLFGGRAEVEYPAPVDQLPTGRNLPILHIDLARVNGLRRVIDEAHADAILLHGGDTLKYAAATRRFGTTRFVYRMIGGAPRWLFRTPRRQLYARWLQSMDHVIAVADAVRDEAIGSFGIPPGDITTVPNGVDPTRVVSSAPTASVRRSLGIPPDATVILGIGALTWEKDPLAQLAVARSVRKEAKIVHLLAGDGPMRNEIENEIQKQQMDGIVRVLGSRSDVGDLLAAADVALFTSRPDGMEGMPAVLIEAGMNGVPAVATNVAGVREVVDDGRTGLLAPSGDVDALTRHVIDLTKEASLREKLGTAAREKCMTYFHIDPVADRYLELCRGGTR